jgi:glycosyltransferase involved in cell wall biosynthesis
MMKTTLFIPVKNEIEALKVIMPRIDKKWYDEIIIIDGGSLDGSKELLESFGYKVIPQKIPGIKAAFWQAFDIASGDIIIPFSPDGNSVPEDIPKLIKKTNEGYDIVVASRYASGMKSEDDDFPSRCANSIFTKLVNILFQASFTDALGMYKAFKKSALFILDIDKHKDEHSEILLLIRGIRYGLKISEIASPEPCRIGVQGSRAHPGLLGKYRSAFGILKTIIRDALFYHP